MFKKGMIMKKIKLLGAVLVLLTLSACKSTPNYISTNDLKTNYNKIGVVSFSARDNLDPFLPQLQSFYQSKIEGAFQQRGFTIVNADRIYDIKSELEKQSTERYNPVTGQLNEELDEQLFKQALQQFQKETGVTAILFPGVDVIKATFSNNLLMGYSAKWAGQSEDYLVDGTGTTEVLGSLFVNKNGYLPGARLFLRFRDTNNNILSVGEGGIELLGRFDDNSEVQYKQADKLFDDEAQLAQALELALTDLDSHKSRTK